MTPVLVFDNVRRSYGAGRAEVTALDGIDLAVMPGELVAVMGASGSGKSTLLNLAGGLDLPSSGTVEVDGHDLANLSVTELAAVRRRHVGYVFQQLNLLGGLSALENVMLPLELDGVGQRDARASAMAALDGVGLADRAKAYPDELSGGEAQRVAIARALTRRRPLLLADEPTGALDTVTGEAVIDLLAQQRDQGTAIVLVTHEPRFAAWADRVVFLRDGVIVDESRPVEPIEVDA
jgi:putative ABC transport system ATP-binding protein